MTKPSLKFYSYDYAGYFKQNRAVDFLDNTEFPCVYLIKDSWDDQGWTTTYKFRYYESPDNLIINSEVKILQKGRTDTRLPNSPFETLNPDYYSIGQEIEYYKGLINLGVEIYSNILSSLNDVVFNQTDIDAESEGGFRVSLLRSSEVEKIYLEPNLVFDWMNQKQEKLFKFVFNTTLSGATEPHQIDFDFEADKTKLNRINVLIGKNGTGKTQVLANFANAVSGIQGRKAGKFTPRRPSFSRVIAISYSVFDNFSKPDEGNSLFSYKYCGIQQGNQILTFGEMFQRFSLALEEIKAKNRLINLTSILKTLLGDSVDVDELCNANTKDNLKLFSRLSSGQNIIVLAISQVVAYILPESIILYDEPELYLHPDALAALARAFHKLLEDFNSFAIIATHSPILLQETPSRNVRIFRRYGNIPTVSNLGIESFGENLTVITDEVFETNLATNNYREYLQYLIDSGYKIEEINALFNNRLSFNAQAFLVSLEENIEEDEDDLETT